MPEEGLVPAPGQGLTENAAELIRRAAGLLRDSPFLVLATSDADGPWAATVNHVVSDQGLLLYCSPTQARHSLHVADRPQVAATVYSFDPADPGNPDLIDCVQLGGRCAAAPPGELPGLHAEFFAKSVPDPGVRAQALAEFPLDRFQAGGGYRLYAIEITECWVRDHAAWHREALDRRQAVPVEDLVRALAAGPSGAPA